MTSPATSVPVHGEAVRQVDDPAGEAALQAVDDHPAGLVGPLGRQQRRRVREGGAGPRQEPADLVGPAVGAAVVDDDGVGREGAQRGLGVAGLVRGEVRLHGGGQLVGTDARGCGHAATVRPPAEGGSRTWTLSPGEGAG